MGRVLAWCLGLTVCLLGGLVGYAREIAGSGLPLRAGERELAGLEGSVRVRFDPRGIPHVRGGSTSDLARALGYLHANDRMFQMELGRRLASGRLAEVLGPALLGVDLEHRTLDLRRVATRSVERSSPRAQVWYAAYAEGVNAWLAERGPDLPPELRLLQLRPEPWTPADSASFALLMAKDLVDPGEFEQVNLDWLAEVGPLGLSEILGVEGLHVPPGIHDLALRVAAKGAPSGAGESAAGFSNNWAVGGAMSASGGALLANDPHLNLALPAQFFVVRLSCPGFEVLGASLPGHPAIVIGRSDRRAWALTNTGLDVDDVTVEELSDDGQSVRRPEGWEPVRWRRERFEVRFGD
ncbi:MAG: penicillin acylase family protein, partial [Planctomycetota bacterium]